MTATCRLSADGRTIIVDLPIAFRRIGGRKQVILPDGGVFAPPTRRRIDGTMIKALARAFRWRKLLENGRYATVGDLASAEKITDHLRQAAERAAGGSGVIEARTVDHEVALGHERVSRHLGRCRPDRQRA